MYSRPADATAARPVVRSGYAAPMADPVVLDVEANGLVFETLVAGPDAGDAVLLLHGYPQSAGSWTRTIDWLASEGYRAIAPNLRGYSPGASPRDAAEYAMDKLVADVVGIADTLGVERFHVVGHDWGGGLAWAVATAHPERVITMTSVSTPHPLAMLEAMRTSLQSVRSVYMAFFRLPRVPELLLQGFNYAQLGMSLRMFGLPAESWRRDRRQLQRAGGMRGPLNWYRGATKGLRVRRRVSVPTLYVWGERDPFLGRRAAELTAKFVSGPYRFEPIPAGHWIPERDADALHALLGEHLGGHPAAATTTQRKRATRRTARRTTRRSRSAT